MAFHFLKDLNKLFCISISQQAIDNPIALKGCWGDLPLVFRSSLNERYTYHHMNSVD